MKPATRSGRGVAGTVDDLLALAQRLAGEVDAAWTGDAAERRAVLTGLDRVAGVLAGVRARAVRAERDSAAWQRPGVPSFEAARAAATRSGLAGASREVRQADTLAAMPAVASAVEAGAMPIAHLDALARVAATSGQTVGAALSTPAVQDAVVRAAARQDAPTFARTLQRMAAELDPASRERAHANQRARRFLHLSEQPDGTHVRGLLDALSGHRLRLALEAVGERPGPLVDQASGAVLEERTSEQARADALDVVARTILSLPQTASGAAVPPQISLLMTEETFAALRERRSSAGPGRLGLEAAGELAGMPAVTLDDGAPVPMSEVAQVLCDCAVTRIVLDAEDVPVNLGRTVRLYSGAHRRAVIARDRRCAFTGCGRPARWCEVHHIDWWERDGGETSLENGVLLCSYHHHQVHVHDLRIVRDPVPKSRRRRGVVAGTSPPGRDQPPDHREPGATYTFTDRTGRVVGMPVNVAVAVAVPAGVGVGVPVGVGVGVGVGAGGQDSAVSSGPDTACPGMSPPPAWPAPRRLGGEPASALWAEGSEPVAGGGDLVPGPAGGP